MLVLALEFSRIRAARLDRVGVNCPPTRGSQRGERWPDGHVAKETAGPLPQNGRARSGLAPMGTKRPGGRRHEAVGGPIGGDRVVRAD
jgi:hypothetical protein